MRQSARGFTLIEVLVTLVIVALGLLGLAGMQVQLQRADMEAYQRLHPGADQAQAKAALVQVEVDRATVDQAAQAQPVTLGVGEPFTATFKVAMYAGLLIALAILLIALLSLSAGLTSWPPSRCAAATLWASTSRVRWPCCRLTAAPPST